MHYPGGQSFTLRDAYSFPPTFGEMDTTLHDAGATLGYDLELHADNDGLRGFFALVHQAADGWEGTELMRPAPV